MARYQAILAYDGTDFFGFQRQRAGRTVQEVVEQALRELGWAGRAIQAAGRTDRGVHASGQVIAFDLQWRHGPSRLLAALNAALPSDVAIRALQEAPADFHPRYDAGWRCYVYWLLEQPVRDPLRERYAWRVWPALDRERITRAASLLVGQHDFAAFGNPSKPDASTLRTVREASWETASDLLQFRVIADGFLQHMVRRMVNALVAIGHGRYEPDEIGARLLAAGDGMVQGLAPPQGLILTEVTYGQDVLSED